MFQWQSTTGDTKFSLNVGAEQIWIRAGSDDPGDRIPTIIEDRERVANLSPWNVHRWGRILAEIHVSNVINNPDNLPWRLLKARADPFGDRYAFADRVAFRPELRCHRLAD